MVLRQQVVASHCFVFLSNLWYFNEIAAPSRAETSVFHIFRLFHKTLPLIYNLIHKFIRICKQKQKIVIAPVICRLDGIRWKCLNIYCLPQINLTENFLKNWCVKHIISNENLKRTILYLQASLGNILKVLEHLIVKMKKLDWKCFEFQNDWLKVIPIRYNCIQFCPNRVG